MASYARIQLRKKLSSARRGILLLDFDGTLSLIVKKPHKAALYPPLKKLLAAISRHPRWTLGVVSGRELKILKKKIPVKKIILAGNHGFEISMPGKKTFIHPQAKKARTAVARACRLLTKELRSFPGAIVENKTWSASLHTRMVHPKKRSQVEKIFFTVVNPFLKAGEVRVTRGKRVLEIRPPAKWDKGKAVLYVLKKIKGGGFPVYVGDDKTDEDAFRALKRKGMSFIVGGGKGTNSDGRIRSVKHMAGFLKELASLSAD